MNANEIKACFVDIDGTLTDDWHKPQIGPGYIMNNALFDLLADVMQEDGRERDVVAKALIEYAQTHQYWDYLDFVRAFDLPKDRIMMRFSEWHDQHISVYDDGVKMVQELYAKGLDLYIISNNPFSGCLLKLQRAGLGSLEGSRYFKGIIASNIFQGQKGSIDYWERAVVETGCDPATLAVVGDHPVEDGARAREVGIKTVFLINREQTETVVTTPEAVVVRRLTEVPQLLMNPNRVHGPVASANPVEAIPHQGFR